MVTGQDPLFSIQVVVMELVCQNFAVSTDDFIFSSTKVNILILYNLCAKLLSFCVYVIHSITF